MHKDSLFVIGNPRSGTSLLRIILNNHQNIVVPPECGFIQWWFDKYKNWPKGLSLKQFISDLKTSKKIETWGIDFIKLEQFLENKSPQTYEELVFSVVDHYAITNLNKTSSKILGDKNNYYIDYLDLLLRISPKAKFILIMRDPKDVFCSYKDINTLKTSSKFKPKVSGDVQDFKKEWIKNQQQIFSFFNHLEPQQFHMLEYEKLITHTENQLLKICHFLSLNFDDKMLRYYEHNDEPQHLLDWKKKTLQPPDKTSIGRYLGILNDKEINEIEQACRSLYTDIINLKTNHCGSF